MHGEISKILKKIKKATLFDILFEILFLQRKKVWQAWENCV